MVNRLDKKNIEEIMGLTSTQEGMLFHYISEPNSEKYHEQLSLTLSGDINLEIVQKAWHVVIETNEILRMIYRWKNIDKPVQIVLKNHKVPITYYDLSKEKHGEEKLQYIKQSDREKRIELENETLRIFLCRLEEKKYELIIVNHHILYDGWSNGIILREFFHAYNALYEGKVPFKASKNRFKEFIKYNQTQNKEQQKHYWQNYLSDSNTNVLFNNNILSQVKVTKEYKYILSKTLTEKINNLLKTEKITMATLLYSIWGIVLQRYKMVDDVLFGTTISGRNAAIRGIEEMVGLFINTLPLRIRTNSMQSVNDLLFSVEKNLNERREYESTSFIDIKQYAGMKANEEMFDSIVVVENYPLDKELNRKGGVINIEAYSIFDRADYNLVLSVITLFEELELEFAYDISSFSEEVIKAMAIHFENILVQIVENPNIKLSDIEMITEEEREGLLYSFNNTKTEYKKDIRIHEQFEGIAENKPNKVALVYEDNNITYKKLNERANQIARALIREGVKRGSIVGILAEKSVEMIAAVIGVLKAGATYLPIDAEYPMDRITYMLKDSKAKILLAQNGLIHKFNFKGSIIDLNNDNLYSGDNFNLTSINSSTDLAYIIYTSGTTGNPKALMTEHRNVLAYVNSFNKLFSLTENDITLQQASFTFDGFVEEVYSMFAVGGKIILPKNEHVKDPKNLKKYIDKYGVTILSCSPLILSALNKLDEMKSVKIFLSSSDALKKKYYSNVIKYSKVYNMYGPTETTVCATCYECKEHETNEYVPIGKPIENYRIYILDKESKLAPIGAVGEVCIGGEGVSRGYLTNKALTEEKFIVNPYNKAERIYRTGDLGRWMPDGNIELIGRRDNQVKIRGYRIEISEIENKLIKHEDIKETVIVIREDEEKNKYLSAYIVAGRTFTNRELREYLLQSMPEYMIPQYFVQIDKMPRSLNGKIDKKALPKEMENIKISSEYAAPRNDLEEKMTKMWCEILSIDRVGIDDNFFEIGGHSLKATTFAAKVYKEFKVEIPLKQIFKTPTIRSMYEYINGLKEENYKAIEPVNKADYYKLSSAQKRLYILNKLDGESTNYNMPFAIQIEGKLDIKRIEDTFKRLIERHESLRTCIVELEEGPYQRIMKSVDFELEKFNMKSENIKPFDLSKAPLFRAGVIEIGEDKYVLIMDMHHIIGDGTSSEILFRDFARIYNKENIEELRIQYKDFAHWQNELLSSEEIKTQEQYWLNTFSKEIPVLNMPIDYARPKIMSFEGDTLNFELSKELTHRVKGACLQTGTSMYMFLLSAYNVLLSKYSGQEEIVVGSPIAGRHNAELDNVVGIFVNTLAMLNYPEGSKTYKEFLNEVKENALRAYDNQDYQFEELLSKVKTDKDLSRNPIFDTMFAVQNMDKFRINIKDVQLSPYAMNNKTSKFDISLEVEECNDLLRFTFEYSTKLFKKETIERMKQHLSNILQQVVANLDIRLAEIDMLTEEEKHKVLNVFNDTYVDYPRDKNICGLFEAQVESIPNNVAVVLGDKRLSYRELNERANSLAVTLREKGVKPNSIVGIMVERSLEMIVGIMGILKAGGAYLPIDPEYPEDRINYMLEDSDTSMLLTQANLMNKVVFNGEIIDLEDEKIYAHSIENLRNINTLENLAYVIYTSGSTGKPKGVMVENKELINFIYSTVSMYNGDFGRADNCLSLTNIVFDVSICEIFLTLTQGAKLILNNKHKTFDVKEIGRLIAYNKVTFTYIPPLLLNGVYEVLIALNEKINLNKLLVGVEPIKGEVLEKYLNLNENMQIVNGYGPTETTICSTMYKYVGEKEDKDKVSIGKPIHNTKIYIVDKNNKLKPIGIPGELCISGEGLSRGYLNNLKLTEEKFVLNPFAKGKKMYKTGDFARWLPDGNIEFIGRIDNQVKVRGFRVELGEIESQLLSYEAIKETIVIARDDKNGTKYLCAYIVADKELKVGEIRIYLSKKLPEYMLPSYFVQLNNMPFNASGKIDKKALPEPELSGITGIEYEAPRNEIEEKLVVIWKQILGVKKVGINDNFFELGGHSLKAIQTISLIHKEFNTKISLASFFNTPTIANLCEIIKKSQNCIHDEVKVLSKQKYYDVSYAQKRLWIINQLEPNSIAYNIPECISLHEKVDTSMVKKVFQKLTYRHEAFRTKFKIVDGKVVQIIEDNVELSMEIIDLSQVSNKEQNEQKKQILSVQATRIFNLEVGAPISLKLVKFKEDEYNLIFCMHHIISDGWSMEILKKEFFLLYNACKENKEPDLEVLNIQYRDYAAWQNDLIRDKNKMQLVTDYWRSQLEEEISELRLPVSYFKNQLINRSSAGYRIIIPEDQKDRLKALAIEYNASLFVVLLSTFKFFLSDLTGQKDILIGTAGIGRNNEDFKNIIGYFVNTIIIRNRINYEESFIELLKRINGNTLKALEYQDFPIELITNELKINYPKISVFFNMLNIGDSSNEYIEDFRTYHIENVQDAKFDMEWYVTEYANGIEIMCDYLLEIFEPSRIEYIMDRYMKLLQIILEKPNSMLKEYNVDKKKRKKLKNL